MRDDECTYTVVRTEHGALAMRDDATGEIMHPGAGPLAEAAQLYLGPSRLAARLTTGDDTPLVLFDVGLGAGTNAAVAFRAALAAPPTARRLHIVSFERTLAPLRVVLDGREPDAFGFDAATAHAAHTLLARGRYESARVRWDLLLGELPDRLDDAPSADIVFWDPYSPRANPGLWRVEAFRALRRRCHLGTTVHTYSAATATRSALLLAGFFVGLGAPSGRKQKPTTVAATRLADLSEPLASTFLAQVASSRIPFPDDAPADAGQALAAHPQFTRQPMS